MRRRIRTGIVITTLALLVGGCSSNNFLVYKDGSNFFVTSNCAARQRLLCASGDLGRIVAGAAIPQTLRDRIKEAICATGVTTADMHEILATMTAEQLSALKQSFRANGYEINKPLDA